MTTPNDEKLTQAESICPDCGCSFPPVPHVRSWDQQTLPDTMRQFGIGTVRCRPLHCSPAC